MVSLSTSARRQVPTVNMGMWTIYYEKEKV